MLPACWYLPVLKLFKFNCSIVDRINKIIQEYYMCHKAAWQNGVYWCYDLVLRVGLELGLH